ncbi:VPEID-CTERM sorting domain-containing protein [Rhodosalinus sp.]|uniref:VPEID-CTERM sorting domain-containing protein n=1 Tax=Rhodosalinus sp. TaxID=2047741 RepID=UPI00397DBF64
MPRLRNITTGAIGAYILSTLPALAQAYGAGGRWGRGGPENGGPPSAAAVPEIDAASGTLAIAAVLAVMALSWEIARRRRRG